MHGHTTVVGGSVSSELGSVDGRVTGNGGGHVERSLIEIGVVEEIKV